MEKITKKEFLTLTGKIKGFTDLGYLSKIEFNKAIKKVKRLNNFRFLSNTINNNELKCFLKDGLNEGFSSYINIIEGDLFYKLNESLILQKRNDLNDGRKSYIIYNL